MACIRPHPSCPLRLGPTLPATPPPLPAQTPPTSPVGARWICYPAAAVDLIISSVTLDNHAQRPASPAVMGRAGSATPRGKTPPDRPQRQASPQARTNSYNHARFLAVARERASIEEDGFRNGYMMAYAQFQRQRTGVVSSGARIGVENRVRSGYRPSRSVRVDNARAIGTLANTHPHTHLKIQAHQARIYKTGSQSHLIMDLIQIQFLDVRG